MLPGVAIGLALFLAPAAAAGSASTQTAPAIAPPADAPLPGVAVPGETVLILGRMATRMTVPVRIDAAGPWHFIIDTGAERTVVSRELAERLGLAAGPQVRVVAMSGVSTVPTVRVPALTVSALAPPAITAPALHAQHMGAVGMLGIDALQGHAVDIDFRDDRMALRPSKKRRSPPAARDEVVVTARSLFGQLIVTDAEWRGRRIAVVIDTGTTISVGNSALLRLMQNARTQGPTTLISATGGETHAMRIVADGIRVGGTGFTRVPLAIVDAAPFARFGLADTPALLMGMDLLRLFRGVRIDFANREIRFALPRRAGQMEVRLQGVSS